eukprot:COSAG02_NODE_5064_length_4677_cov_1.407820_4_plen_70_part_00
MLVGTVVSGTGAAGGIARAVAQEVGAAGIEVPIASITVAAAAAAAAAAAEGTTEAKAVGIKSACANGRQ